MWDICDRSSQKKNGLRKKKYAVSMKHFRRVSDNREEMLARHDTMWVVRKWEEEELTTLEHGILGVGGAQFLGYTIEAFSATGFVLTCTDEICLIAHPRSGVAT